MVPVAIETMKIMDIVDLAKQKLSTWQKVFLGIIGVAKVVHQMGVVLVIAKIINNIIPPKGGLIFILVPKIDDHL